MSNELLRGIEVAYAEKTDLIVFALTGRTGSGCSTAAEILSKRFEDIALSGETLVLPERRKFNITKDYAQTNWVPFEVITVSSVIYSFALSDEWSQVEHVLSQLKVPDSARTAFRASLEELKQNPEWESFGRAMLGNSSDEERSRAWHFFKQIDTAARGLRKSLGTSYLPVFQRLGDNVRYSGRATKSEIDPNQLFSLMKRVRLLIHAAEASRRQVGPRGTRIAVDAIRNPLELVYLRDHFAALFVLAITVDDEVRRMRLGEGGLRKVDIDKIDEKEYGEKKHLTDYASFVSQNIRDCIQKSDLFIANPGKPGEVATSVQALNAQLVRYVALALRPGLVTPTRDERCMQFAFVAKLNSGCISRQVGAAVADRGFSIQAVGWNDVPKGQVPCLLRDVGFLLSGNDAIAFSDFEKHDPKLRGHIGEKFALRNAMKLQSGLSCPYCFRDAYNTIMKEKNQVHTRSLHAEENAFLQLAKRGSTGIEGGVLYTTASPCELCSKKAYQLGIKEVVYVDPYPGISARHVLSSGDEQARPALRLFSGAVGQAYHRLYESIMSIKDEYHVRLSGDLQRDLQQTLPLGERVQGS
jgi:deoxycytidylate deaminase